MTQLGVSDLALIVPELILVGAALVLMLVARRIRRNWMAPIATVLAAVAAGLAVAWGPSGTATGFAGMIVIDGYSRFFTVLIAASLALATLLSTRNVDGEEIPRGEFHVLLLLAATGMMLAVSTPDLLALYLGLELMTICSYILVGITVARPLANEAAIKYFLVASFASALFLYGISLIYGLTGATDFETVAAALSERGLDPLLAAAILLIVAGLAFKIAVVPFHAWAPDAYQGASSPVAAFLAAASKAAGLAALGRVAMVAFGSETQVLGPILWGLAALSILYGSITALAQTDMKRLLAYSSISHAGYALLGLVGGTAEGTSATMTYAFIYVFMTLGAFGVVVALGPRGETLDGYQGLGAQRPLMAGLLLLFLLSLTGIPPTAGFMAKFTVILSAERAGHVLLAVLAVICSVISAFVYMRVAVNMFMREPQQPAPSRFPVAVSAALAIAAVVTILGGILPAGLLPWAVSP
ncbi:MAG: NADH-quinone oxidoreductase subunit N [Acidobacteriota bacterium]|nr:NADH-quinone oxidoreductase subunit N [Acidobacteriota bacterium]